MSISNVSLYCERTNHWASHGIGRKLTDTGAFLSYSSDICTLKITNNNSSAVNITSITLPLGTGTGSVYGKVWNSTLAKNEYKLFTVTGKTCSAKIINTAGTTIATADVSTSVSVASRGSTSSSGYFNNPSAGTKFSCNFTVNANSSVTLGIGVSNGSGSTSGPILSCDNGYNDGDGSDKQISRNVDCSGNLCSCSISSVSLDDTDILAGTEVTATANGVSPNDDTTTVTYKWYNASGTELATGNKRTPTSDKEYCKVTVAKSGYSSASATSSSITYRTRVTNPAKSTLIITGSKNDNRYTDRESYTFAWGTGTKGTNNDLNGYYLEIYRGATKVKEADITATGNGSKTYTAADLGLSRGNTLYFRIKTKGKKYNAANWVASDPIDIVSSAVVHVNKSAPNGKDWTEGIVYVNTGTTSKANWVEATEVAVNDNGTWKLST